MKKNHSIYYIVIHSSSPGHEFWNLRPAQSEPEPGRSGEDDFDFVWMGQEKIRKIFFLQTQTTKKQFALTDFLQVQRTQSRSNTQCTIQGSWMKVRLQNQRASIDEAAARSLDHAKLLTGETHLYHVGERKKKKRLNWSFIVLFNYMWKWLCKKFSLLKFCGNLIDLLELPCHSNILRLNQEYTCIAMNLNFLANDHIKRSHKTIKRTYGPEKWAVLRNNEHI